MIKKLVFALVSVVLSTLPGVSANGADDSLTTAVFSKVSNGYKREKLADGSFKREYYAISNGGYSPGMAPDASIDDVPFPLIAGVVAQHLARENYFLAKDAKSADLLLVIKWGASIPFNEGNYRNGLDQLAGAANLVSASKAESPSRSDQGARSGGASTAQAAQDEFESELTMMQLNNRIRDKANERNAVLLGYVGEINSMAGVRSFGAGGTYYDDLISDIEDKRYYVIVSAYDFHATVKEKTARLLWSTRVSIQAQGNRFDERLMTMMANASRQFGQDSGRLIRQFQRVPKVNLGELKFLGVVPDSTTPHSPAAGK